MKTLPNWDDPSRTGKWFSRQEAFTGVPRACTGIFLPGAQCACVRTALDIGLLNLTSRVIAVERDRLIAEQISRRMSGLGFADYHLHTGPLARLQLDEPIDFAFLDFLGTLTFENAAWLADVLSPHLTPGATAVITLSTNPRGSRFMPDCDEVFENELFDATCELAGKLQCFNYEIVNVFALFKCIFNQWDFKPVLRVKYRDSGTAPMCCYKLLNFQIGKKSEWPGLDQFMFQRQKYEMGALRQSEKAWVKERAGRAECLPTKIKFSVEQSTQEKHKNPIMVEAGKKAWITRRARASKIF